MPKQLEMFSGEERDEDTLPSEFDPMIDLDNSDSEPEEMPAYLALLKEAIPPDDEVLRDYVEIVGPKMVKEFSLRSAKGGSNPDYSRSDDQSMLTHILNGIFPTLRIVRESGEDLSELEKHLYLIAYTFHDLNKLDSNVNMSVADDERAHTFFQCLNEWAERLSFNEFFPNYTTYQWDIAFLILNTQRKYDANP